MIKEAREIIVIDDTKKKIKAVTAEAMCEIYNRFKKLKSLIDDPTEIEIVISASLSKRCYFCAEIIRLIVNRMATF